MLDAITEGLLYELTKADEDVHTAAEAIRDAEIRRAIALTGFEKIYSLLKHRLGKSPFTLTQEEWPHIKESWAGQFRYMRMPLGEAVIDALQQYGPTMRIEELTDRLRAGGARITSDRELHAALINKSGIERKLGVVSLTEKEVT